MIGNAGSKDPATGKPAQFSLGGLALLSARPLTGGAASAGDAIIRNRVLGNHTSDVMYDGSGTANHFTRNNCGTSTTPGVCRTSRT